MMHADALATSPRAVRIRLSRWVAFTVAIALTTAAARADQYDAPSSYYSNATGTGTTLKSQLYTITKTGFVARTYGDARYAMAILDKDPANPSKILLAYNRASVSGTWDAGVTFNREHVWPKSLLNLTSAQVTNSYSGPGSDLFELRPANPNLNSDRSNYGYGNLNAAKPAAGYGLVSSGGTFWYPGDADRGDVARTIFYVATRYGPETATPLTLVNGAPSTYQMGDLNSLLHWNYQDEVDDFERRRNQTIYSSALNPSYYQGNRNPFIDHPEYVWSIFGTSTNNSRLSVATAAADGSSAATVDLGRVIVGSVFGTQSATLNKSGTTPTTFDATVTGGATSTLSGPRHSFDYNAQARTITVGLSGSTSTTGPRIGAITFDNTDLTTAGAGMGSADGNDAINVTGTVVTHAKPSLASDAVVTSLTLDFGIVARGSILSTTFDVFNGSTPGAYVAGVDVDGILSTGDSAAFTSDAAISSNLVSGASRTINTTAVTTTLGLHSSTLSLAVSDENIPGASDLGSLTVTLQSRIAIGGDATLDNAVNFDDLLALAQNYGLGSTQWATGDFTRDQATNFDDLLVLAQNYGMSAVAVSAEYAGSAFASDWALAQSLVPEPGVALLLAFAPLLRRRRA